MRIVLVLFCLVGFLGCVTSAKNLKNISIGMDKEQVAKKLGDPESVSSAFTTPDGKSVEVWDYRLSQYEMATTLSPYFDIYSLLFVDGKLKTWSKSERGARLSESGAMKLLGYPDAVINVYPRK